MSDLIPVFVVLVALGLDHVRHSSPIARCALPILVALSVLFHAPGALSFTTVVWNTYPRNIDEDPSRIWSVARMQSAAPLYLRVDRPRKEGGVDRASIESEREAD